MRFPNEPIPPIPLPRADWALDRVLPIGLPRFWMSPHYKYFRIGSSADVQTKTQAGFALMGGGKDLDQAFKWMCERSGGGDFLVLRATGDDAYNPYIQGCVTSTQYRPS